MWSKHANAIENDVTNNFGRVEVVELVITSEESVGNLLEDVIRKLQEKIEEKGSSHIVVKHSSIRIASIPSGTPSGISSFLIFLSF